MKHKKSSRHEQVAHTVASDHVKDIKHRSMYMGREGHSNKFAEGHDEGVGRGDFANMPREVVMRPYPAASALRGGMLDDTITGIDAVQHGSEAMTMRHLSNQK
jgi:hypothetical protein